MQRETIEHLFYGRPEHQRRFTQDFPVLPDVWIEYGKDPKARIEVLLTPTTSPTRRRWPAYFESGWQRTPVARSRGHVLYNESVVMAALTFPELLRCAVPLTAWWQRSVAPAHQDWTRRGLVELAGRLAAFTPGSPVLTTTLA
jgi:hypothetical protein